MISLDKDYNYNIIIVGVGGTGSHLISFLSQLIGNNNNFKHKHKIILVDGDTVEEKNLRTQKFLPGDVGKLKAEVLSDRYSSVFDLDISYVDKYIENSRDIELLMDNYYNAFNIIVSCVDNNKARKCIDDTFNNIDLVRTRFRNLVYIDTGNSSGAEALTGQTVIAYKNIDGVVLPSASTYFPQILEEEEIEEPVASCGQEMLHNIQNIGANITSAVTVFNILNNIIGFNQIPGDLFMFNATNIETESLKVNIE